MNRIATIVGGLACLGLVIEVLWPGRWQALARTLLAPLRALTVRLARALSRPTRRD